MKIQLSQERNYQIWKEKQRGSIYQYKNSKVYVS